MFSMLSKKFLFFLDCFPVLAVKTVNGSHRFLLLQDVLPFSRLFFTFSADKVQLEFLVFGLTNGISGWLHFCGTQLYFSDTMHFSRILLINRLSSQVNSSQAASILSVCISYIICLNIFRHFLLFSNFLFIARSPLWLLTSGLYTCLCSHTKVPTMTS